MVNRDLKWFTKSDEMTRDQYNFLFLNKLMCFFVLKLLISYLDSFNGGSWMSISISISSKPHKKDKNDEKKKKKSHKLFTPIHSYTSFLKMINCRTFIHRLVYLSLFSESINLHSYICLKLLICCKIDVYLYCPA